MWHLSGVTCVGPCHLGMQVYTQSLRITNKLRASFDISIRPGSAERYSVSPASFRLKPEETQLVEVKLRVTKFAQKQKAVEQGHKDVFHIKVGT
jgi:hypothetical protein